MSCRFLQPAFWRLKKTLQARYDFSQHAVTPAWSKVLGDLSVQHKALAELEVTQQQAATDWRVEDVDAFRSQVVDLKADQRLTHPSVKALLKLLAESDEAGTLIDNLAGIHDRFTALDETLGAALAEAEAALVSILGGPDLTMAEINRVMEQVKEQCPRAQVIMGAAVDEKFRGES